MTYSRDKLEAWAIELLNTLSQWDADTVLANTYALSKKNPNLGERARRAEKQALIDLRRIGFQEILDRNEEIVKMSLKKWSEELGRDERIYCLANMLDDIFSEKLDVIAEFNFETYKLDVKSHIGAYEFTLNSNLEKNEHLMLYRYGSNHLVPPQLVGFLSYQNALKILERNCWKSKKIKDSDFFDFYSEFQIDPRRVKLPA